MVNYDLACTVCGEPPIIAKGYCNTHYLRNKRNGDPNSSAHVKSKFAPGTVEHFHENTKEVVGPLDTPCLEWQKATTEAGYGVIGTRPLQYAHRFSYENFVGPIGELYVCHKCDNPTCCNAHHLFLGDDKINSDDKMAKGRDRKNIRLSAEQIRSVREQFIAGLTDREIAVSLEVQTRSISNIRKGRTYNDIS